MMKISLFVTCLSDALFPRVAEAMARLLGKYGVVWNSRKSRLAAASRPTTADIGMRRGSVPKPFWTLLKIAILLWLLRVLYVYDS